MAMLQDHRNQIYIVILTSGNVGTLDPKISKTDLSRIRKKEEIDALECWNCRTVQISFRFT